MNKKKLANIRKKIDLSGDSNFNETLKLNDKDFKRFIELFYKHYMKN